MPTLSQNDPEPVERKGPPIWVVLAVLIVIAVVALHFTGVVGPR